MSFYLNCSYQQMNIFNYKSTATICKLLPHIYLKDKNNENTLISFVAFLKLASLLLLRSYECILLVCMTWYRVHAWCLWRPEEGHQIPYCWNYRGCEPPRGGWRSHAGPLERHLVLLTTSPWP